MSSNLVKIAVVFAFIEAVICAKASLPSYITACHKSDPDLNACGLKQAKTALIDILKGDKNFKLPVLSPLKLPEVSLNPSASLSMKFKNLVITGLETAEVKDIRMNIDKNQMVFVVETSFVNLQADYEMEGRILIFPVVGKGPCNITFARSVFSYEMNYDFVEKKGETYAKIVKPVLTYETDRTYYHFDNLFNGDPRLGPEINKFMNENWRDLKKDIGPAFEQTVETIITSIASSYFNALPFNVILPD